MKIAYVRWRDAVAHEAKEEHTAVNPKLSELHEVGFWLGETEDVLTIGMEIAADGETAPGRWRLHIPKVLIQELKIVEFDPFMKIRGRKK